MNQIEEAEGTIGPKEGTFMWAVEQMKQGRTVRRAGWKDRNCNIAHEYGEILRETGEGYVLHLNEVAATDWEIYEEPKKTLWDKIQKEWDCELTPEEYYFTKEDVKEALKEFIRFLVLPEERKDMSTRQKAREIFGKELLEEE